VTVALASGETRSIPACTPKVNGNAVLRRHNEAGEAPTSMRARRQLPADYNGWLQYAAFNHTPSFESMTNLMSTPDVPAATPQILYLFPGLQNIDWIPKVDPEPTQGTPFDIIQPVLQYPGITPDAWGVRSWYVTVNAGALRSTMLEAKEGDDIECNMTRTGKLSWFIGAKLPDGRSTNQKISIMDPGVIERMKVQPWAYVTLECYGCTGCRTYPKTPVSFSDIKLYGANQSPVVPTWLANPKPQPHQLCTEATHIKGPDEVDISFQ